MRKYLLLLLSIYSFYLLPAHAQVENIGGLDLIDFGNPREFELAGITVSGVQFLDESVLITLTGLNIGDRYKVPGDEIAKAIENLWKQGLLADVKVVATKITGDKIFLNFKLTERPRLSKFAFSGISKNEAEKLREKIQLAKGKVITENLIYLTRNQVRDYYVEKGFLFIDVDIKTERDSAAGPNQELMRIAVSNRRKVKINDVIVHGNKEFTTKKVHRKLKGTKIKGWYKIFTSSKFSEDALAADIEKVEAAYAGKGYRDASVTKDTVYRFDDRSVNVEIWINEGKKYFFRNITWVGNTKYSSTVLSQTLGIKKGDVYNQAKLEEGLFMSQNQRDISSLYMDDGYLFFQVTPVEVNVENDSIDLEMRIYEGKQATINRVTVKGNTKTNDKVVLREIRTKPGELFNRADIIRTQRELAQLGYFDQEKLSVNPKPNPADGTVDIEYTVEERPSDQLELSGGWGGGAGVVGTLGISFNNFSARNIFNTKTWSPLPTGDGQRLSLRFQSNGRFFQSYNASFTEPYLGGKKPNAFSVSLYESVQTDGLPKSDANRSVLKISGISVGLGRRLKFPDDFFQIYHELTYQRYSLDQWSGTFLFSDGSSNNINFEQTISRNSVDGLIWIRSGSQINFTIQLTPPWSLFDKGTDFKEASAARRYKWIEYHKWKFSSAFYKSIGSKFVLFTRAQLGILGYYNSDIGFSPFERFYLGGDGLSGFALDGREIIALRGYENNTVTPRQFGNYVGGTTYHKYTMELRFPVSLNPSATIYTLAFLEGGNNYLGSRNFNPLNIKRSAGVGVRIYLPMFGLLGLDWGYGFDEIENLRGVNGGQFHFTIGQQF